MMSGKQQRIWNRRYVINLLILTAALLIPCLTACGGSSSGTTLQPEILTPPGVGDTAGTLPAGLPEDGYVDPAEIIARRGSVYDQTTITGLDYSGCGPGAMPGPASLLLVPGTLPVAWVMYSFPDNLAEDTPLMLTVELTPALPSRLFLAIADYDSNSWHWLSFDNPGAGINLVFPAELQPVSRGGRINVLLLVEAGDNASISALRLHRDVVAPPPADFATGRDYPRPDMISLSWTDPAVTWPGLSYDAVRIERATVSPGTWEVLADIPAGQTEYADTWSTENDIPYDWDVYYRLRTVVGDIQGLPCIRTPGRRLLQEITQFTASDGDYPDRVRLTWDPVPGAESYELDFYFGEETLPASAGITEYDYYWDHFPEHLMGFGEWDGCNVKLRACWQELTTDWISDDGYRGLPDVTNIQATKGVYPDKVVITWDPVPGATGYKIGYHPHYTGGIPEWPWSLDTVDGGDTCAYEHTYESPVNRELPYNGLVTYGVEAMWNGEWADWTYEGEEFSFGYRFLQPPAEFHASDDEFSDRIRLTWQPVPSATGYLVYRDGNGSSDLVATLGDVTTWDDLGITDTGIHTYWIRSTWAEHTSDFSPVETGSVSLFDIYSTGLPSQHSTALIDNKPAVIYTTWTEDTRSFHYAGSRAELPTGPGDWDSHHLFDGHRYYSYCGIGEVSGLPAVVFGDRNTGEILYAYADTTNPVQSSDWHSTRIRSDTSGGSFSITEINGLPAVAYGVSSYVSYSYAYAALPLDDSDWNSVETDVRGYGGLRLLNRDDLPVILAFYDCTFATSSTATPAGPSDWSAHSVFDTNADECSLAFNGNIPVISWTYSSLGYLYYSQASVSDPAGSEDWNYHCITDDGLTQSQNCIVVIDGKPLVVYRWGEWDAPEGSALKVAMATTTNPQRREDWDQRIIISSSEDYYDYGDLEVLVRNGKPLIFFNHEDTGDLVYATLRD